MIAIEGGMVLTPTGLVEANVAIEGSRVVGLGVDVTDPEVVIDASGCLVGPGFVDAHVHFRDPGQTWKEDLLTGSASAAVGGYTAAVVMPNTDPAIDDPTRASDLLSRGNAGGPIEISVAAALTRNRAGSEITDLEGLYELGVRIFSDDGDSVADTDLLALIMSRLADLPGAVLAQHAEDRAMTVGGQMHQGAVSDRLGLGGIPAEAETSVVARDLELVGKSGVRYHCQHISAGATLVEVSRAKKEGLDVTAEVTPHHLVFSDLDVASIGTNLKMYPPVRGNDDREALVTGLKSGVIDMVATDHAPHSSEEKAVSFADAPRGVIGLETAASAVWQTLEDPLRFFEVMSAAPARLAGFENQGLPLQAGNTANLVVFDRGETWTVGEFKSRSANSPFTGMTMTGRVKATIYQGKITHGMSTANV